MHVSSGDVAAEVCKVYFIYCSEADARHRC